MQPDAIQHSVFGLDDQRLHGCDRTRETPRSASSSPRSSPPSSPVRTRPRTERDQVIPAVLKLTADPVARSAPRPRRRRSRVMPALNADILFAIISDDDEIALPFLSVTPALNHWHMLAVLRVGDEARRAAVALRPDVSREAIDYVVESLPLADQRAAVRQSECVTLHDEQFQRLYDALRRTPPRCWNACSRAPTCRSTSASCRPSAPPTACSS